MKFTKYIYIALLVIFSSSSYSASTGATGWREISEIGCHLGDGTCYVTLDIPVGPSNCNSSSIRWNKDHSDSGKETLSLLIAASAAGKKVNFYVSGNCYGNFPTFLYMSVKMK
ncbi:hypothetical protein ACN08P_09000 [Photobacterium leiognathi subsp. mandapamensis]|uniref:hypothetical protein n=1 Tax=Photobacterium leiognathi TaxID=553611 RepID=UPI003AF3D776